MQATITSRTSTILVHPEVIAVAVWPETVFQRCPHQIHLLQNVSRMEDGPQRRRYQPSSSSSDGRAHSRGRAAHSLEAVGVMP